MPLRLELRSPVRRVLVGIWLAFLVTTIVSGQSTSIDAQHLKFNKLLERKIKQSELHEYRLRLRAQQVLSVELQEQSFDVKVELVRVGDHKSVATANLGAGFAREQLIFAAEESGDYLIRIDPSENQFGIGSYRFTARLFDRFTETDKTRNEALRLLSEAVASQKENTALKIREAIAKREQALTLWQKIGDQYWEGRTLDRLGAAHNALFENNKAVDYLSRALVIVQASGDKLLEAATLNTIGSMTNGFGEHQQAVTYHNQALKIFQTADSPAGIINSTNFLGNAYVGLKDYPKANEYFQHSLMLAQKAENKHFEAYGFWFLGTVLDVRNEKSKALEKYSQALTLWRERSNKNGIAQALNKIGRLLISQGETEQAIHALSEALALSQTEKARSLEAEVNNQLATLYYGLKQLPEAIECYQRLIAYYREFKLRPFEIIVTGALAVCYENLPDVKEAIRVAESSLSVEETVPERWSKYVTQRLRGSMKNSKALTLQTLGRLYFNSGDTDKALQYHSQAFSIFEKNDDQESKLRTMVSRIFIADVHQYRYEWDKALENYEGALAIAKELNDKVQTITILNSIGLVKNVTGDRRSAIEPYTKALEEFRLLPDRNDQLKSLEASIVNNLGTIYLFLGEPGRSLEYHNRALAIQQEVKDVDYIDNQVSSYGNLALVRSYLGENKSAIELLDHALELYRQVPQKVKDLARNRTTEAAILNNLGVHYRETGNFRLALEYYNKALQLTVDAKREGLESTVLNNIALVYQAMGDPRKALENFDRALNLDRKHKNIRSEATILNNIGQAYWNLGDTRQSLNYSTQSLEIAEKLGDKEGITTCLNNLGNTYAALSDNVKALDYFSRALAISRETGNRNGELTALNNFAFLYSTTGERGKAFENYEKALSIVRSIGAKASEATLLGNIAIDYLELGETQTALEYRETALKTSREIGNISDEIFQLIGIASIYRRRGEESKSPQQLKQALINFEQALKLSRETENKANEADALLGIGKTYVELNDAAKAVPVLNEVLAYAKKNEIRFYEAAVQLALGNLHEKTGTSDKAIEAYQQSLIVAQAITDKDVEAKALKGLMSSWKMRGNDHLAIFYGKQAVNKYQELRGSIRSLRRETQNVYRDKVTDTYRELADLLIAGGQLRVAEQVLAMLKEQEAFEFVRRDADEADELLSKRITPDPNEQKAIAEYVRLSNELTAKSQRLDALRLKPDSALSQTEQDEKQKLEQEVADANEGVLVFFRNLESEFTKKTAKGGTITGETIDDLRKELRRLGPGVILISTYLLPQRYRVIVGTGNTIVDRKKEYQPLNLDAEKVNQKIMEFKQALQDPRQDPRPLGKELYDIFFKPIERDIENSKATTLLWSLDGSLRYIPVGALYDGKQFLAERYQNVFVTLAVGSDSHLFNQQPRTDWRVLGLGVSKPYKNFKELPSVPFELRTIVRDERVSQDKQGVLAGIRLLDSEFTEESFVNNLRQANGFNVVHLATHFRLGSNLDNSGLLLGDGEILSLYTINKMDSRFDFKNVELLTLSACETGVTLGNSNGREVESLGMIAQKNGAKAILATLWKVADTSTAILMSEFYRLRKANPRLTKAQALQMAQKSMLEGTFLSPAATDRRRDTGELEELPPNTHRYFADPKRPYAHPYYWAPFILIGNWR